MSSFLTTVLQANEWEFCWFFFISINITYSTTWIKNYESIEGKLWPLDPILQLLELWHTIARDSMADPIRTPFQDADIWLEKLIVYK